MRNETLKSEQQTTPSTALDTPKSDWLNRFADCLLLLHPGTIATAVAKHVAATSPQDSELEPEEAAMKFIFEQPIGDVPTAH
jgi:hypothetical protein